MRPTTSKRGGGGESRGFGRAPTAQSSPLANEDSSSSDAEEAPVKRARSSSAAPIRVQQAQPAAVAAAASPAAAVCQCGCIDGAHAGHASPVVAAAVASAASDSSSALSPAVMVDSPVVVAALAATTNDGNDSDGDRPALVAGSQMVATAPAATANDDNDSDGDVVLVKYLSTKIPAPPESQITFEFTLAPEDLQIGKTVMGTRSLLARIPFEVGITVFKHSTVPKLGLVAICGLNENNPHWEIITRFDVDINSHDAFHATWRFCSPDTKMQLVMDRMLSRLLQPNSPYLNAEGKMPIKVTVTLKESKDDAYMLPPVFDFSLPHKYLTNATIDVEGTLFYVDTAVMSMHSDFFYEAYYGRDGAKNREMLVIDNCSPAHFKAILEMIYPCDRSLTDLTVTPMLRLANRFKIPHLITKCIDFNRMIEEEIDVEEF